MYKCSFGLLLNTLLFFTACQKKEKTLFTLLPSEQTGISFINQINHTDSFNCYTYRAFYNGGGVGLGDINNDGLVDVFFCGNMQPSRLYLNKGNFKFEDITEKAGVACKGVWATGIAMADVNGDGFLDIYVCKSGQPSASGIRHNELFINNGNALSGGWGETFTEKSKEYGLDNEGLSTHAAFFDFDKDGDLDCYLLNNSFRSVANYDKNSNIRNVRDTLGGNTLYRNDKGKFVDISTKAGIFGSSIGFGLGVTIGDVNRDGWQDIYVSNDFFERDYLYLNDKKGGFREGIEQMIPELSMGSMGADMADINNDGFPEIFVTEMLPQTEARLKTKTSFDNWNKYQMNLKNGYHRQFPRNVLQLNNGCPPAPKGGNANTPFGGERVSFSEIGRLAGVHATDWSWGALIADLDNDGFKDIFVANGIYKDLFDQDYLSFMSDPNNVRAVLNRQGGGIKAMVDTIPSEKIANCAFQNKGDLTFEDKAKEWGLAQPSFSNGSAYADLDNDGDLDLVVNNVNMPAFVYRNETNKLKKDNHFLSIILRGANQNTFGLGAQVTVYAQGKLFYQEVAPMRGFQSCVDSRLVFGLGSLTQVDSVVAIFLSGKKTVLTNIKTNETVTIIENEATEKIVVNIPPQYNAFIFNDLGEKISLNFKHTEAEVNAFDIERLLFQMPLGESPKMAKGDVNGDGLEDIFIGNGAGHAPELWLQIRNSGKSQEPHFKKTNQSAFETDKNYDCTATLFFDADKDGDLDLFVGSGGYNPQFLADRLYKNDGKGNFTLDSKAFGDKPFPTACAKAYDFDQDGDLDLFVGMRQIPNSYGKATGGFLLKNDGTGHFSGVTGELCPELKTLGMICDAEWVDIDGDKDADLIVVGEWIPLSIFKNEGQKFTNMTKEAGLENASGWWNCIDKADLNGDGLVDFVIGNHGLNSRFKADGKHPLSLYANDFDGNGSSEPIICNYNGEKQYPMVLRQDIVSQMPILKKKYLYFKDYKEQTMSDIFTSDVLKRAVKWDVFTLKTAVLLNKGGGKFEIKDLPIEAQFSPTYAIAVDDFDKDGKMDILLGGNFSRSKPEIGTYLASYGTLLRGDGKGDFTTVKNSGFHVAGEIRDFSIVKEGKNSYVLVAMNNDKLKIFKYL
jgi:enediyne biosynthesis protein E4